MQVADVADVELVEEPVAALWAPGSAVLALGEDVDGAAALALWQISPDGHATGSWVVSQGAAFGDLDTARRLIVSIERRAITAADPDSVGAIVERLTSAAGLDDDQWWNAHWFSSVDVLGEVVARRAEFEATVAASKKDGKHVAALQWARDLPADELPQDFAQLRALSGLGIAPGPAVVSEVLTVSRVLGWLAGVWAEVEQVKNRRRYVRDMHGAPEALPPSWLAAVQTASATRLPL